LQALKRFYAALASYDQAIALKPDVAEVYANRGNALQALTLFDAALASYDQAIALKPNVAEVYSNRGNVLLDLKRFDAALASYDQAIALKPDIAEAYHNKSLALLLGGNLLDGWKLHEWRWATQKYMEFQRPTFTKPLWLGDASLAGKTI